MSNPFVMGECPRCARSLPIRPSDALIPWHLDGNNVDCPGEGQEPSPVKHWAVGGFEPTRSRVISLTDFEAHTGGFEEHQLMMTPGEVKARILRALKSHTDAKVREKERIEEEIRDLQKLYLLADRADPSTLDLAKLDTSTVQLKEGEF